MHCAMGYFASFLRKKSKTNFKMVGSSVTFEDRMVLSRQQRKHQQNGKTTSGMGIIFANNVCDKGLISKNKKSSYSLKH